MMISGDSSLTWGQDTGVAFGVAWQDKELENETTVGDGCNIQSPSPVSYVLFSMGVTIFWNSKTGDHVLSHDTARGVYFRLKSQQ